MECFNQLNAMLPTYITSLFLSVFVLSLLGISYLIGYFFGSRRYEFYSQGQQVNLAVTRYFFGFIPINKKTYQDVNRVDIEKYIDVNKNYDVSCARVYIYLTSGKKIELKRLSLCNYERHVETIFYDIESLLEAKQQNLKQHKNVVVHNCRTQSFIFAFFAYALMIPLVLMLFLITAYFMVVVFQNDVEQHLSQHYPEQIMENELSHN